MSCKSWSPLLLLFLFFVNMLSLIECLLWDLGRFVLSHLVCRSLKMCAWRTRHLHTSCYCHFTYTKRCRVQQWDCISAREDWCCSQLEGIWIRWRGEKTQKEHRGENWKRKQWENDSPIHPSTKPYCSLGPSNCMAELLRNKADWLAERFRSQLSLLAASPASNEASGGGALIRFSSSLRKRPPRCPFSIPVDAAYLYGLWLASFLIWFASCSNFSSLSQETHMHMYAAVDFLQLCSVATALYSFVYFY